MDIPNGQLIDEVAKAICTRLGISPYDDVMVDMDEIYTDAERPFYASEISPVEITGNTLKVNRPKDKILAQRWQTFRRRAAVALVERQAVNDALLLYQGYGLSPS